MIGGTSSGINDKSKIRASKSNESSEHVFSFIKSDESFVKEAGGSPDRLSQGSDEDRATIFRGTSMLASSETISTPTNSGTIKLSRSAPLDRYPTSKPSRRFSEGDTPNQVTINVEYAEQLAKSILDHLNERPSRRAEINESRSERAHDLAETRAREITHDARQEIKARAHHDEINQLYISFVPSRVSIKDTPIERAVDRVIQEVDVLIQKRDESNKADYTVDNLINFVKGRLGEVVFEETMNVGLEANDPTRYKDLNEYKKGIATLDGILKRSEDDVTYYQVKVHTGVRPLDAYLGDMNHAFDNINTALRDIASCNPPISELPHGFLEKSSSEQKSHIRRNIQFVVLDDLYDSVTSIDDRTIKMGVTSSEMEKMIEDVFKAVNIR